MKKSNSRSSQLSRSKWLTCSPNTSRREKRRKNKRKRSLRISNSSRCRTSRDRWQLTCSRCIPRWILGNTNSSSSRCHSRCLSKWCLPFRSQTRLLQRLPPPAMITWLWRRSTPRSRHLKPSRQWERNRLSYRRKRKWNSRRSKCYSLKLRCKRSYSRRKPIRNRI